LNYAGLISIVFCFGVYQAYPFFKKKTGQDIYKEYINYVFGLFFFYVIISSAIIFLMDLPTDIKVVTLLIPFLMGIQQLNYVVLIENPKLRNTAGIRLSLFDIAFLAVLMIFTTANYLLCITFIIIKNLVYFLIAVSNPMNHSLWLTMSGTVTRLWQESSTAAYYTFIISLIIGMIAWFALLNFIALKGHKKMSMNSSKWISKILMWAILIFGIVFVFYGAYRLLI
jgi:hypothetical protein